MSLFGALNLGGSSLAAQQTALQVTGNNIANAGTVGYTRQAVNLTATPDVETPSGVYAGSGVTVSSIQRQVSTALNESVNEANSDQNAANTLNGQLTQLQTIFGPLNQGDLASQLTGFFNGFSTLANNPTNSGQQSLVIQNGVSLAQNLQSLRGQVTGLASNAQAQVTTLAQSANSLANEIASLNQQITTVGTTGGAANSLLDQRDQDVSQLSQLMDVRVVDQGGGNFNVLVGSTPLVTGDTSRGVSAKLTSNPANNTVTQSLVFGDNGDPIPVSGGQIGGLINAQSNYITPAVQAIDAVAAGLISTVNTIHSQGQGQTGFSTVTGTTQDLDPTATLNSSTTGIAFPPTNGSFNLYMTDATTGQTTTQQINVNLSGQGTQTTLNSLAASISTAGGGTVTGSVNASGNLVIASNNPNVTFSFGQDTSGTLAALGINTFFTGNSAANIGVNSTLLNNPSLLAVGQGNNPGSSQNAQALALAGATTVPQLGGMSVNDYYQNYIGNLASAGSTASTNSTAQTAVYNALSAQQQAISGVSMDQETINLMQYQRAFEGSANFITIVNQMMATVTALITE